MPVEVGRGESFSILEASGVGKMLLLTSWKAASDAEAWTPASFAGVSRLRHRRLRNIRDYGMFERREAPQFYPEVRRH